MEAAVLRRRRGLCCLKVNGQDIQASWEALDTYIYIYIQYACTYIYIYTYAFVWACVCMHMYICIHVCIHTYTHTHIDVWKASKHTKIFPYMMRNSGPHNFGTQSFIPLQLQFRRQRFLGVCCSSWCMASGFAVGACEGPGVAALCGEC